MTSYIRIQEPSTEETMTESNLSIDVPRVNITYGRNRVLSTGSSLDSETSHGTRRSRLNMPMMYQMYESQYDDLRGTIFGPESPDFHPVQASETLRKSLHGLETNDQMIIKIILLHNNFQRQKILNAYEDMYNRNLVDDLEEEAGGYFLETCQALFKPAPAYDAQNIYKSLSNRYSDRSVAIEIACTRTSRQLRVVKETYQTDYRKPLDKDISIKVEGIVGKILSLLLNGNREESLGKKIDESLVEQHAQTLLSTPIDDIAKNVQLFEELFITPSWKHIGSVLDRVDEVRRDGLDVETILRRNKTMHSELRLILQTIVRVSRNMQLYFAEKLRNAMNNDRADNPTIIRICVTRSEIDLFDIAEEYKRKYHRSLEHDIAQSCSGDYMRLICHLINGTNGTENSFAPTPESIE